jgi:ATP:ADP antiporter, AAA family
MGVITAIGRRIRMEPRELADALGLGAILMAITCSYTLVKVSRDALFLSVLPARALPVVYLIVGVITLALAWAFGRLTRRWSPLRTLIGGAAIAAAVLAAFAFGFRSRQPWMPMAFYTWVNVYGLLLTSQFWIWTNSVSDPREARNIFGIVGGGGILGGLIGGIAAATLASRVSLASLALAGAAVLGVMVMVVALAVHRGQVRRPEEPPPVDDRPPVPLARVPYLRWLALVTLCSVVVSGLLDFQLRTVVQRLDPSVAGLTSFFGRYFVVMNVCALGLQLLGTRWFLERFGAPITAGFLPAGLAIGAGATLVAPGFWPVLVTRMWDQVARFSIHRTTTEVFYFPLHADLRRRAKSVIEAGIERVGDALAGLLILGLGALVGIGPHRLAGVIVAVVAVWLFAWWRVRRGYVRELARHLRQVGLTRDPGRFSLHDRGALQQLVRTLESPYERVVLQALDMLEEHAPALIARRLPALLEHPSPSVRARAVAMTGARADAADRERIEPLLRDRDARVRVQALRAWVGLGEGRPVETLRPFLDADDPGLRAAALAGIVEHAGDEDLPRVRALLEERLASGEAEERVIAAEAIGARPAPSPFEDLLPPLFEDPDPAVRRAAIVSAGRVQSREHVPALIGALADRSVGHAARDALVAYGDKAVGTLGDWLVDPSVAIEVRRLIPRVLQELPSPESVAALFRPRETSDVVLDYRVLKAANHLRNADGALAFPADRVYEAIERDVRELLGAEIHARSHADADEPAERFLLLVLRERRAHALDRVFRRLALIHPPASIFAAWRGLTAADGRVRGNAVEFVENVLDAERRPLIMPLMPDADEEARLELARTRFDLAPLDRHASLARLLEGDDAWLRAAALYVIGRRRERALIARVESNLESTDPCVRETAGWARTMLAGGATR